jgi:hypothetical protein
MKEKNTAILPFKSTSISESDVGLYKASGYIPTFRLLVILTIFSCISILIFDWIAIIGLNYWFLDFLSLTPYLLIWLIGIGLIIVYLKLDRPLTKVSKSLFPVRLKSNLELFPIKTDNIMMEFYNRLKNVYDLTEVKEKEHSQIFEKSIQGKKNKHKFDLFFFLDDNSLSLSLISVYLFIFLVADVASFLDYYGFTDLYSILISICFLISIIITIIYIIYKFFYFNYYIITRYIKNKLTIKDIDEFKKEINDILSGKKEPYISVIMTDKEIDNEIINLVQSNKGKIKGRYPITLIQRDKKRFKLIWTESFIS